MRHHTVIVGGGTAGWMTAAYLKKAFGDKCRITLIESARIPTIGVGEATFSSAKLFFDFLGLREHEWMPSCNAAYKLAIKFVNWTSKPGYFYHPFERYSVVRGAHLVEWWLKLKRDEHEPFDKTCFITPALCDAQRSPRFLDGSVYDDQVQFCFSDEHIAKQNVLSEHTIQNPYGYHFDAGLLARFLSTYAIARGVEHVVDDVVDIAQKEDGSIAYLQTKEHGQISADLYVDCSGFRGLLINETLKEPLISFSESLPNDRAVALQVPVDIRTNGINPYTTATALSSGWVWNIPLYGRIGTGYVYCSRFISPEEAEKEFRAHLGPAADACKANHIKMRIGRNRNSWVKNCVAIGLSSGFVEPLESTGIFFIQYGIEQLVNHFPGVVIQEEMVKSFNDAIASCIDGVRDFLVLHYHASDRADTPYWKATKEELVIPESLRERLKLWRVRLPNSRNINMLYHGFEAYSYSCMLLGLNYRPESSLPTLNYFDDVRAQQAFAEVQARAKQLVGSLPSQYEYLSQMHNPALRELVFSRMPQAVAAIEASE